MKVVKILKKRVGLWTKGMDVPVSDNDAAEMIKNKEAKLVTNEADTFGNVGQADNTKVERDGDSK
jgi:hypothetical protein